VLEGEIERRTRTCCPQGGAKITCPFSRSPKGKSSGMKTESKCGDAPRKKTSKNRVPSLSPSPLKKDGSNAPTEKNGSTRIYKIAEEDRIKVRLNGEGDRRGEKVNKSEKIDCGRRSGEKEKESSSGLRGGGTFRLEQ